MRQSPALVVAMIALFVALSGTAVATTSALITGAQIKNSSITGIDVKNRSLTPVDFRGSVRGPAGPAGPAGAAGAQGAQGAQGIQGLPGPVNIAYVTSAPKVIATGAKTITNTATCPAGLRVSGGGVSTSTFNVNASIDSSLPSGSTGWFGYVNNTTGGNITVYAYAVCVSASAVLPRASERSAK